MSDTDDERRHRRFGGDRLRLRHRRRSVAQPDPRARAIDHKGVSLSATGPFEASLTTTVGTTVHYRITVTNTGNVTLHHVTLTDDKFTT